MCQTTSWHKDCWTSLATKLWIATPSFVQCGRSSWGISLCKGETVSRELFDFIWSRSTLTGFRWNTLNVALSSVLPTVLTNPFFFRTFCVKVKLASHGSLKRFHSLVADMSPLLHSLKFRCRASISGLPIFHSEQMWSSLQILTVWKWWTAWV